MSEIISKTFLLGLLGFLLILIILYSSSLQKKENAIGRRKEGFASSEIITVQNIIWKNTQSPSLVSYITNSEIPVEEQKHLYIYIQRISDILKKMYSYCNHEDCRQVPQSTITQIQDLLWNNTDPPSMMLYIQQSTTISKEDKEQLKKIIQPLQPALQTLYSNCIQGVCQ